MTEMIRFLCPGCGKKLKVPCAILGRKVKCSCGVSQRSPALKTTENHETALTSAFVSRPETMSIGCRECGRLLNVKNEMEEKRVKCPHCQRVQLATAEDDSSSLKAFTKQNRQPSLLSFQGRIGRGSFWATWLGMLAFAFVGGVISAAITAEPISLVLRLLILAPLCWIGLAMQVKRWQDLGYSGTMVLLNAIPWSGF